MAGASTSQKIARPSGALQLQHGGLQQLVEHPHAARLDDQVGAPGVFQGRDDAALVGRIDDDPRPVRVGDVAVLLPFEGVGLVEGDAVAALGERPQDAAVVGGGAVPVGGDEARSEEGDFQSGAHGSGRSQGGARRLGRAARSWRSMASSSSTRWAQVCRSRMVSRPAARPRRAMAGSPSRSRRWRFISPPSRATRKSRPGRKRPSASFQGAETRGMPQARASNGADGRDARQRLDVGAARHVDGRPGSGRRPAAPR